MRARMSAALDEQNTAEISDLEDRRCLQKGVYCTMSGHLVIEVRRSHFITIGEVADLFATFVPSFHRAACFVFAGGARANTLVELCRPSKLEASGEPISFFHVSLLASLFVHRPAAIHALHFLAT